MAEVRHTCAIAQTVAGAAIPCPGCQALFETLCAKEREVLEAALALAGSDLGRDDGTLLRVAREYAALRKASGRD